MLLTLGISHKTAPIAIREKLAFSPESIPSALRHLKGKAQIQEVALLSTCNRTELYCQAPTKASAQTLLSWWQHYQETLFELNQYTYLHCDRQAVTHMMRVASGLDSMLLGEPQILGQLKSAYQMANDAGTIGSQLSRWFETSFSVAKTIRTETEIARYPVSMAYAAVNLAKQIFTDLSKTHVLLIGAGENSELILEYLQASSIATLSICNRTIDKATRLAKQFQGNAYALNHLNKLVLEADIVISAINVTTPILEKEAFLPLRQQKRRPKLIIDLGVPRNIAPDISHFEDIYLYSVDDLQHILNENLKSRERAAVQAEKVITLAAESFINWLGVQKHHNRIRRFRDDAYNIQQRILEEAFKELDQGKPPKIVLERFAHRLTQKLIHQPTLDLRETLEQADPEKSSFIEKII